MSETVAPTAPDPTHTTPSERIWEINCFLATEQGLIPDPGEVERAMIECGAILQRIGGVMSLASVREEVAPGRLVTTKLLVRWQSFVPKMSGVLVQPEPEIDPAAEISANGNGDTPE